MCSDFSQHHGGGGLTSAALRPLPCTLFCCVGPALQGGHQASEVIGSAWQTPLKQKILISQRAPLRPPAVRPAGSTPQRPELADVVSLRAHAEKPFNGTEHMSKTVWRVVQMCVL